MAFLISYQTLYVSNLLNLDFTDSKVIGEISKSEELTFVGSKVIVYLQPALELQLGEYVSDLQNFYNKMSIIMWIKAGCFSFFFIILYVIAFTRMIQRLINEIYLAYGMINIIPVSIMHGNTSIKNILLKQKKTF